MTVKTIAVTVNNVERHVTVKADTTLLDVMRDELGLTGVRAGCRRGGCGSCSVMIDGALSFSCLTPAMRADGRTVETIEGVAASPSDLHPIQRAFIKHGSSQCGFCSSGMVMSAKALLDRTPKPTRDDVVEAISGNTCRCTGYASIVDAILEAADELSA
ncbi:MAG: (2Fe-2S)-binding protein [Pseudomonadota bacterium]